MNCMEIIEVKKEETVPQSAPSRSLNEFRKNELYCDYAVKIGDKRFPCHRVILASASEYFHSLMTTCLRDENGAPGGETILVDVSEEIFECILTFVYCNVLRINFDNAFELLKASDFLRMEKLVDKCVQFIEKNPKVNNLLDVCLYANRVMKNSSFAKNVASNIAKRIEEIIKLEEFLNTPFEVLQSILEERRKIRFTCALCNVLVKPESTPRIGEDMIQCKRCYDYMTIGSDEFLFEPLVKWIQRDVVARLECFPVLSTYADLPTKYASGLETLMGSFLTQYLPSAKKLKTTEEAESSDQV